MGIPLWTRLRTFARTLIIQGSWNYRTMIGTGFAFALLPVLRRVHGQDEARLDEAIGRHAAFFNAHPYFASMAVAAVSKLEAEGEDPEVIERFKVALRGPLGALGDRLVWARWLPVTAMAGIIAWILGAPPLWAAALFLIPYNVGHIGIRVWGFRTGLRDGRDVGSRLRTADLGGLAGKLGLLASCMVGVFLGALVSSGLEAGALGFLLPVVIGAMFWLGVRGGARVWRPAVTVLVSCVVMLAAFGALR